MSIVINGTGSISGISVGGLPDSIVDAGTLATNSVTAAKLEVSAITGVDLPTGSVLQVVSVTKTDTFTYSASSISYADVTGLAAAITPTSSSSKILVQVNINFSNNKRYSAAILLRGSTQIGKGTAVGNRPSVSVSNGTNQNETNEEYIMRNSSFSFLDSPSTTNATTYKVQVGNTHEDSSVTYVNRSQNDSNATYGHRGISTITLTEVAG